MFKLNLVALVVYLLLYFTHIFLRCVAFVVVYFKLCDHALSANLGMIGGGEGKICSSEHDAINASREDRFGASR